MIHVSELTASGGSIMQVATEDYGRLIKGALHNGPLAAYELRDRLGVGRIDEAYRRALDEECDSGRVQRILRRNPCDARVRILYRLRSETRSSAS